MLRFNGTTTTTTKQKKNPTKQNKTKVENKNQQ